MRSVLGLLRRPKQSVSAAAPTGRRPPQQLVNTACALCMVVREAAARLELSTQAASVSAHPHGSSGDLCAGVTVFAGAQQSRRIMMRSAHNDRALTHQPWQCLLMCIRARSEARILRRWHLPTRPRARTVAVNLDQGLVGLVTKGSAIAHLLCFSGRPFEHEVERCFGHVRPFES